MATVLACPARLPPISGIRILQAPRSSPSPQNGPQCVSAKVKPTAASAYITSQLQILGFWPSSTEQACHPASAPHLLGSP